MVKYISSLLHYDLMNDTIPLLQYYITFSAYYDKKHYEDKSHRVALSHLTKKLIRVMFTLENKDIDYNFKLLV